MFGYPEIERAVFKNNFLRSIIISIVYDPVVVTDFQDKIKTSLIDFFPRFRSKTDSAVKIEFRPNVKTPIVNVGEGVGGYQLQSEDGLSTISFENTGVTLNIAGVSYKKFDDIRPLLSAIQQLLKDMGVKGLKRLSIRKLNVANFETQEIVSVFEEILNPRLATSAISAIPNIESVLQHMITVSLKDGEYRLNLAYGIPPLRSNQVPVKGIFVEDIDVIRESTLTIDDLMRELNIINQAIFEVFMWINSDKLRQRLIGNED